MDREDILQALREVHHPARQDRDIVDLGMVHDIEISDQGVVVTLGFPKRRDPLAEYLVGRARASLNRHLPSSVKSEVRTVVVDEAQPKPKKKMLDLGLEQLAEVRHIVGIASGKGGVGKSTWPSTWPVRWRGWATGSASPTPTSTARPSR